ncbi:hypothetical protein SAMN05216359_102609 [Roseateles sp. YR242]|uniref:hypothetical protein n=1 Tax=Roseateles sp. YR242 TaxID=1855305 RepID=UPI0008CF2AB8|nr:hypothetical protein [Roseateles sp. YR242]SEK66698.1 hypothetical protein SAMN05216359_102609 [Roseateles sp. YR242]
MSDLPRLARALEYLDMASALYLAGGADHSAQLLAAAGERLLGDLARLIQSPEHGPEVQQLLSRVAQHHPGQSLPDVPGHAQNRQLQQMLSRQDSPEAAALRQATSALLRASWYLMETMGLESLAPSRLHQAIEKSTIYAEL